MATLLTKTIKRQLLAGDRHGRTLLVELEPGDMLTFRVKGKRTKYEISLHSAYVLAAAQYTQNQHTVKLLEYKAGKRARKPKPPTFSAYARQVQLALAKH